MDRQWKMLLVLSALDSRFGSKGAMGLYNREVAQKIVTTSPHLDRAHLREMIAEAYMGADLSPVHYDTMAVAWERNRAEW